MNKKILIGLFTIVMCFALVGCEKEKTPDNGKTQEQGNNNNSLEVNNKDSEEEYNIKLYSDDTKMVFNFSNVYYITYYYSGDKITGLEYVYDCQNKETAKLMEASIKANYKAEDNIKSVERKSKYIIVTWTEEEYKDNTVEEIKETYSYLEQVQKEG